MLLSSPSSAEEEFQQETEASRTLLVVVEKQSHSLGQVSILQSICGLRQRFGYPF